MKINMVLIVKQIFLLSWAGTQTFIVALVILVAQSNSCTHYIQRWSLCMFLRVTYPPKLEASYLHGSSSLGLNLKGFPARTG